VVTSEFPNQTDTPATGALFDPLEIRVLGVLAEKEALTPDNYPLSMNALTNGCNQLTSREPVMSLSESEVQQALQQLMEKRLVAEVSQSGARVTKYEHRMRIKWMLEQDKLAILTILMLRGPQTAGEIRNRSGRMHEFSSVADVEAGLQFLIDKFPPLVVRLARTPGTKEARYAHLLGGEPVIEASPDNAQEKSVSTAGQSLEQEVADLRAQVEWLTQQFEAFKRQFD
jgi:uncharacterized protein YceH (UPF0502 family)